MPCIQLGQDWSGDASANPGLEHADLSAVAEAVQAAQSGTELRYVRLSDLFELT